MVGEDALRVDKVIKNMLVDGELSLIFFCEHETNRMNIVRQHWSQSISTEELCLKILPDGTTKVATLLNCDHRPLKDFLTVLNLYFKGTKEILLHFFNSLPEASIGSYSIQQCDQRTSIYVGNFDAYKGFGIGIDFVLGKPKVIKMYLQSPGKNPLPYSKREKEKLMELGWKKHEIFMWQYVKPFNEYFKNSKWTLKNVYIPIKDRMDVFRSMRHDNPIFILKSVSFVEDDTFGYYEQFYPQSRNYQDDLLPYLQDVPYRSYHGGVFSSSKDTFESAATKNIRSILPFIPKNAVVLDVGCGYSGLSELLSECRPDITVWGLTNSKHQYEYAIKRGFNAIHANFVTYQFKRKYDCLLFNESFCYMGYSWKDKQDIVQKCKTVANKIIMIAVSNDRYKGRIHVTHVDGMWRNTRWFPYHGFFSLFDDWNFEAFKRLPYCCENMQMRTCKYGKIKTCPPKSNATTNSSAILKTIFKKRLSPL